MNRPADQIVEALDGCLLPELARLLADIEAEIGPQPDGTLLPAEEGRSLAARLNQRWNRELPRMECVEEAVVPADEALGSTNCRVKILVPPNARDGALLFIHGGGFAFCSPETHERCARLLAVETGLPILMPDYRLAPEHPFPAGLHDVVACLDAVVGRPAFPGMRPGPLLIAGDSAGANLALSALLINWSRGKRPVDGALLFYGVYDADFGTPSYNRFVDGPGLTTGRMQRYWDWYLADVTARQTPLASPLRASEEALAALPPLFLMAAEIDPLLSDTLNLADRLRRLGRGTDVHLVKGVTHGFLQLSLALEAAREALKAAAVAAKEMVRPDINGPASTNLGRKP